MAVAAVAVAGLAGPAALASPASVAPSTSATELASGPATADVIGSSTTPAGAASGPLRLPGGASQRGILGRHAIYPFPVYFSGDRPTKLDQAAFDAVVSGSNDYWSTATQGKITVGAGWSMPAWTKLDLTAAQLASCDKNAIYAAVRKKIGSAGERDHLVVILNNLPQCGFTDLEQVGLTSAGDGYSLVNGTFDATVAQRAIAHNGGAPGAGSLNCVSGSTPVPLSADCTRSVSYNNPWDPASGHPYGQIGTPIAHTLATLQVLSSSEFPQIDPGASRTLTLSPLSVAGGQKGAYFDLDGYRYLIDYRIPTGLDAWIDDKAWTGPKGNVADPGGGVILHRIDLSKPADQRTRYVVDFNPDATISDTGRHPGLAVGESYTAPGNSFALTVVAAGASSATVTLSFPSLGRVDRWSGPDRYSTSAAISGKVFGAGVGVAYVASGELYTDALSGAPVAGKVDGPVLLVGRDSIPTVIATELRRLRPGKIVIFGGPATITPAVQTALQGFTTGEVVRWSGADRFETSAAISRASYPTGVATAYIASGRIFTDALSGAPVAGKSDGPVLLVDTDKIPASIQTELTRLKPGRIVVFGGANTITEGVREALADYTTTRVERWWGADRFSTSAQIVTNAYQNTGGTVFISSGRVFTDALSGAPVAGTLEAPVLLVDTDKLPDTVAAELTRLKPAKIVVLGGPNTITFGVQAALAAYLP